MTTQINNRWSFSDEDATQLTCLSNIGQEIQLFLSATEDAVQQMATLMQRIERELQYRFASDGGSVMGSSSTVMKGSRSAINEETHTRD